MDKDKIIKILQEQVDALEKLNKLNKEIIKQLEDELSKEKTKPKIIFPFSYPHVDQNVTYCNPFNHDYDQFTYPRRCKKCGVYDTTITYGTTSTISTFGSPTSVTDIGTADCTVTGNIQFVPEKDRNR